MKINVVVNDPYILVDKNPGTRILRIVAITTFFLLLGAVWVQIYVPTWRHLSACVPFEI